MHELPKAITENQIAREMFENVCRRVFANDPCYHYPTEYQGQIIYFCTEYCRDAFQADPDRFYSAHNHLRNAVGAQNLPGRPSNIPDLPHN